MKVIKIAMMIAAVMVFFFSWNAQAAMTRVYVDAFTANFADPEMGQQLNLVIHVADTTHADPPNFVSKIDVNAPDGSVLSLHPTKNWHPYEHNYWRVFKAEDFDTETIPGGIYYVTVTPISGSPITEGDAVPASFLPFTTITQPVEGGTVGATPTFKWRAVTGASYYVVLLWNKTWNEPVFWLWERQLHTDFAGVTMPPGVMKPNCDYELSIEARYYSQDLDKRSRSIPVNFKTGSWQ